MAFRKITFTVSGAEGRQAYEVVPSVPQDGGVAGDHKALEVVFVLPSEAVSDSYVYRFEYVDGMDNYDTMDTFTLASTDREASVLIPRRWTYTGGIGELRLVISELDDESKPLRELYTFAGRLKFAARSGGTQGDEAKVARGLSSLLEGLKDSADEASGAAVRAGLAADDAEQASGKANTAAENADTATERANQAAVGAVGATAAANAAAGNANAAAGNAVSAAVRADTAAGKANTAATNANTAEQELRQAAADGEFDGPQGIPGADGAMWHVVPYISVLDTFVPLVSVGDFLFFENSSSYQGTGLPAIVAGDTYVVTSEPDIPLINHIKKVVALKGSAWYTAGSYQEFSTIPSQNNFVLVREDFSGERNAEYVKGDVVVKNPTGGNLEPGPSLNIIGPQGKPGTVGPMGTTAYESALAGGFPSERTEAQFNSDLAVVHEKMGSFGDVENHPKTISLYIDDNKPIHFYGSEYYFNGSRTWMQMGKGEISFGDAGYNPIKVQGVADPFLLTDAANKEYVDTAVSRPKNKLISSYTVQQTDTYVESIDFAVGADTSDYVIATVPTRGSIAVGNTLVVVPVNPQDLRTDAAPITGASITVAEVTNVTNDQGQPRLRLKLTGLVWTRAHEAKIGRFYFSKGYAPHAVIATFSANTYKEMRVKVRGRLTGANSNQYTVRMGPNGWGANLNSVPAGLKFIGSDMDNLNAANYTSDHFNVSPAGVNSFVMDGVFSHIGGYSLTGTILAVHNVSAAAFSSRTLGLRDICPAGYAYQEYITSFEMSSYLTNGIFTTGTVFEFYEV